MWCVSLRESRWAGSLQNEGHGDVLKLASTSEHRGACRATGHSVVIWFCLENQKEWEKKRKGQGGETKGTVFCRQKRQPKTKVPNRGIEPRSCAVECLMRSACTADVLIRTVGAERGKMSSFSFKKKEKILLGLRPNPVLLTFLSSRGDSVLRY